MMPIRRAAAGLLLLAVIPSTAVAQTEGRRPMTITDLITAIRVGDPQVSPDGRRVVFVRTTTDSVTGKRNADIWVVASDGSGRPRPLIAGPGPDDTPRFLVDGRIAFISARSGTPQVYLADASGGHIRAVTRLSGGVQPPLVVSPDGRRVAYVSDAYPQCSDDPCNAKVRDSVAHDPVKLRRLTRLPYRHWTDWWEQVRHHVFVTEVAGGATRDLTPGDYDSPPHNYEDGALAFSPDSREIAFVSKRGDQDAEMWTTNHDVWTVPVTGGEPTRITSNPAADVQPVYSPDGKSILVRAQRRPGFETDRWYLDIYDRSTGAHRTVFESPDLPVEDFRLSADGATVWFSSTNHAAVNLYRVPLAGGEPTLVLRGGAVGAFQPAEGFVVAARSTLTSPAELVRVDAAGTERPLTAMNAGWLGRVEQPTPSSRMVIGAGGDSVQYWLLLPPGLDSTRRYPVVFLIHGGPQGDWADAWSSRWNPALWAAQGWIVAAPNPRGSTGFGQRFVDEISQDWCGKPMIDLDAVFDTVASLPYADTARMGLAGASYGGFAVDWLIGHTNRFKAAVSHDGVFNIESMSFTTEELWFPEWEFGGPPWTDRARRNFERCSPHRTVDRIRTPTLVITNQQDFRVPVDQGLQLFTALRRNGVESEGLVFEDEGHWVLGALDSRRWHETVFGWMRRHLTPAAP
jgi:dipeptidyl aminopeptidase/acylaminoacyl peptidase